MSNTITNQMFNHDKTSLFNVAETLDSRINFLTELQNLVSVNNGKVEYVSEILRQEQDCSVSIVDYIIQELELTILKEQREFLTNWFADNQYCYMSAAHANSALTGKGAYKSTSTKFIAGLVMVSKSLLNAYGYFREDLINRIDFANNIITVQLKKVICHRNDTYTLYLDNSQKLTIGSYYSGYFIIC